MGQSLNQRGAGTGSAVLNHGAHMGATDDAPLKSRGVHFLDTMDLVTSAVGWKARGLPSIHWTEIAHKQAQAALNLLCIISLNRRFRDVPPHVRFGCGSGTCTQCHA